MPSPRAVRPALLLALLALAAPAAALGDLVAAVQGDRLAIAGGPEADVFVVDQEGLQPGSVRVVPGRGTTVNGSSDQVVFTGVARLSVEDEGGDADVTVQFCELPKGITVRTGDGDDSVTLHGGTTGKRLDLDLGTGNNFLLCDAGAVVDGRLRLRAGDGHDGVQIDQTAALARDLLLEMGGGLNQLFLLAGSTVGGRLLLRGGDFDDVVVIDQGSRIAKRVRLLLAAGNNLLMMSASAEVDDTLDLQAGAGLDQVLMTTGAAVTRDLKLRLGDGDNQVGLSAGAVVGRRLLQTGGLGEDVLELDSGASVASRVLASLGAGSNVATLAGGSSVGSHLDYRGEEGDDSLVVSLRCQVAGNLRLRVGDGNNSLLLDECILGRGWLYQGGAGIDQITSLLRSGPQEASGPTEVGPGKTVFLLGEGTNTVQAGNATFHGPVRVVGGTGDDVVDFGGAVVEGAFQVVGKGGQDTITPPAP